MWQFLGRKGVGDGRRSNIPWSPSSKSKVSLLLSSGLLLHVCILEHKAITL